MSDKTQMPANAKRKWEKPAMQKLGLGLDDFQNGLLVGNDGAGGLTTSLS